MAEKLTELLPDVAKSETVTQESSELDWDKKLHYTKRVKLAVELATTNPDQVRTSHGNRNCLRQETHQ